MLANYMIIIYFFIFTRDIARNSEAANWTRLCRYLRSNTFIRRLWRRPESSENRNTLRLAWILQFWLNNNHTSSSKVEPAFGRHYTAKYHLHRPIRRADLTSKCLFLHKQKPKKFCSWASSASAKFHFQIKLRHTIKSDVNLGSK